MIYRVLHHIPTPDRRRLGQAAGALFVAVAILLVFGQSGGFDFLDYDDDIYVTRNHHIQSGLTVRLVQWAFTTYYAANWHPLTWLSHALDWQLYGSEPRGHHLTNVALHAAVGGLLFWWIVAMTGARAWVAGAAVAWFALHPLRAESVAWVAQRKELLAALFGLMALLAYGQYARHTGHSAHSQHRARSARRWGWYGVTLVCFGLALMAKPVLVTLPIALLLLDVWPLDRFRSRKEFSGNRLSQRGIDLRCAAARVLEKLPLMALAIASSVVTLHAQQAGGAVADSGEGLSLAWRLSNAVVNYSAYVHRTLWPSGLMFIYPLEAQPPTAGRVVGALLVLVLFTAATAWWFRRRPYLFVGWSWFVISLVPMIGLVQVGLQATADRYTYWPHIGIALALAGLLTRLPQTWRLKKLSGMAILVGLATLGTAAWRQTSYWQNTLTLTQRALRLDPENYVAHQVRGWAFFQRGELSRAYEHYARAVELRPSFAEARVQLATVLLQKGRFAEAAAQCRTALKLKPNLGQAHQVLGVALAELGHTDEAIAALQAALAQPLDEPTRAATLSALGFIEWQRGQLDRAESYCQQAVALVPTLPTAHLNLAIVLASKKQADNAAQHLNIALSYATGEQAIALARQANRLTRFRVPELQVVLADALAGCGRFVEAAEVLQRAIQQAQQNGARGSLNDWEEKRSRYAAAAASR